MPPPFTREQLTAYLEDALSDSETAQVEQALRNLSPSACSFAASWANATVASIPSALFGDANV